MRDEQRCFFAGVAPAPGEADGRAVKSPQVQRVRGVAGQLRPYRDIRAGFEPWRRLALMAWTEREKASTVH